MAVYTPIKKQEVYRIPNTRFPKVENAADEETKPEPPAEPEAK